MNPVCVGDPVEALSAHVAEHRYDAIPEAAVAATKQSMIDTLAVAWAGAGAETCASVHDQIVSEGGRAEAQVWVFGERVPAASCAYVNSLFASALDYDGIHEEAGVHADIVVLPAALAVAERQRCSGREFLTALTLGTDVACRLGLAMGQASGWFNTSVFGVFGAAAAAARLLGLRPAGVRDALGLAFLQASGTYQPALERSLAKRHQSALAARAGVFAALLAQTGVTAPKRIIEGECGLYRLYGNGDSSRLLDQLGTRFEGTNVSLKSFPACFCSHAAIQGTLEQVREHDLRPADIAGVQVSMSPYMHRLVGAPFEPSGNPQVTAQFSVQYAVAVAVLRQRFAVADLDPAAVLDTGVREFASKVTVTVDPANHGTVTPVTVIVRTQSGASFSRDVESLPGMPSRRLTDEELMTKVCECFESGPVPLDRRSSDVLLERVAQLEDAPDMSAFFEGLLRSS